MRNKKILLLMFFGIFLVLSMYMVSAYMSDITITSNATNGSTWFKGGSNQSFNFSISAVGLNASTNITEINISVLNGTTIWGSTILTNNSNWTCSSYNSTYSNCSSVISGSNTALNITLNMTLNSTVLEQNHTITFKFTDNFTGTNTTRMLLQVDGKTPTITTPFYAWYRNTTSIKINTSESLTFNISVTDAGSGGTECYVNFNDTNQSFTVDGDNWCNFTVGNLTNLGEGNQTILLYINDSVNNLALNNSLIIQIDTVNPVPTTAACTPTNPTDNGETVTCTCSGTDATSGVDSSLTTAQSTTVTSVAGSFSYTCSLTDYGTNTASATTTYTVTGGSSTALSGGGGGGSGTITSTNSNLFTKITPGKVSIMKNFDEEVGVKEIQIEVINEVQNVKITVSKYDGKPAEVSVEKTGKVYQYMQINVDNLGDNLQKATVSIKVKKTWVSDNSLEKDDVALFKFNEETEEWGELVTIFKEEDDTYHYFDVELTSFSYFAISEKTVVEEEEEEVSIGTILGDLGEEAKKNLTWLWVLIVVLIIIAAYVAMNRIKR